MGGTLSYFQAGGIDRPLVIWKSGVGSVVTHQNWRGQFARGTWGAGHAQIGRSSDCTAAYSSGQSCVPVPWPGWNTGAWFQEAAKPQTVGSERYWLGSLSVEMRDASGLMYKRNRYYNPQAAQFTQPDPIGLVGGLNIYGFAAGDPVGYSDPSGLCAASQVDHETGTCPGGLTHGEYYMQQDGFLNIPAPGSSCEVMGCRLRAPSPRERQRVTSVLTSLRTDLPFCLLVGFHGLEAANRNLRFFDNPIFTHPRGDRRRRQLFGNAPFDRRLGGIVMYLYGRPGKLHDHDIVHEAVHAVPRLTNPVQGYPDGTNPYYFTPLGSIDQTASTCMRG